MKIDAAKPTNTFLIAGLVFSISFAITQTDSGGSDNWQKRKTIWEGNADARTAIAASLGSFDNRGVVVWTKVTETSPEAVKRANGFQEQVLYELDEFLLNHSLSEYYGHVTTQAPWINDVTGIKRCTPVLFATAHSYEETVQYLLSHVDVDINLQDKNGRTVLFVASQIGHEGIVKSLISQVC